MKKILKFLFPVPSLIILALAGISFSHSDINGSRVLFFDWLGLLMVFFVMFVIPFDIAIWLLKNIYKALRKKVSQTKNKRHLEENSGLKIQDESLDIPKTESIHTIESTSDIHTEPQNDILTTNFDTVPSGHTFYVDSNFKEAGKLIIENNKASIGMLQREFKIGFKRAACIMDQLYEAGVVGLEVETKPRELLMTMEQYEFLLKNNIFKEKEFLQIESLRTNEKSESHISARIKMYNNKFDYMSGHDFEEYCAILLRSIGYSNVEVTKESNDNGIDILATKEGVKYGIQCKCYSSDIGIKAVQEAFSGARYYDCHVPVVLTNRYFSRQAKEMASKTNVLLWDRDFLTMMSKTLEK